MSTSLQPATPSQPPPAYQEERAELVCQMGGSDKVYNVQLTQSETGWTVTAQSGARGSTLTGQKPKITAAPYEKAKTAFDKLVAEKLKGKGDGTHYSHAGATAPAARIPAVAPALTSSRGPVSPDVIFAPELLTRITEAEAKRFATDPRYLFQTKQDGDRLTIRVEESNIYGFNKLGQVVRLDARLHSAIAQLCDAANVTQLLIDGELEADGFHAWDMLECRVNGNLGDLRTYPYCHRLRALEGLLQWITGRPGAEELAAILHLTHTAETTDAKLALLGNRKLEGVAVKDAHAPFRPGRNGQHKKFKFEQTASFIVGPKPARKANDGHRSVALYILDPAAKYHAEWEGPTLTESVAAGVAGAQTMPPGAPINYVSTVKVPDKYPLPLHGSVIEVRYLYAYPGGGIAQPCYFGKIRTDVRHADCTTAQLKFKYSGREEDDDN